MENIINNINTEEYQTTINECITGELKDKREAFEKMFKDVPATTLERWFKLDDFDFYSNVAKRFGVFKFMNKNKGVDEVVDNIGAALGLEGKSLYTFLNSQEGRDFVKDNKDLTISTARVAILSVLGILQFTATTVLLSTAYVGRVGGKFIVEISKAIKNTLTFAVQDGKVLKMEVTKAWEEYKPKTVVGAAKDRI